MLPNVIELYPSELVELASESLAKWNEGLISRAQVNDEMAFLLMLFHRKKVRIPERNVTIVLKRDGTPSYDSERISAKPCCPDCGLYFFEGAVTFYIHPGLKKHDKYVYSCTCGSFYAVYNPKDCE